MTNGEREFNGAAAHELKLKPETFALLHASKSVSYTHLRAHETVLDLVCRLLLEKKKEKTRQKHTPVTRHKPPKATA